MTMDAIEFLIALSYFLMVEMKVIYNIKLIVVIVILKLIYGCYLLGTCLS